MTPILFIFLVVVLVGCVAILADHFVGIVKDRRKRRETAASSQPGRPV